MEAQDIGFIIASVGGLICSIIYALKHIKKSECSNCISCSQDTGESGSTAIVIESGAIGLKSTQI